MCHIDSSSQHVAAESAGGRGKLHSGHGVPKPDQFVFNCCQTNNIKMGVDIFTVNFTSQNHENGLFGCARQLLINDTSCAFLILKDLVVQYINTPIFASHLYLKYDYSVFTWDLIGIYFPLNCLISLSAHKPCAASCSCYENNQVNTEIQQLGLKCTSYFDFKRIKDLRSFFSPHLNTKLFKFWQLVQHWVLNKSKKAVPKLNSFYKFKVLFLQVVWKVTTEQEVSILTHALPFSCVRAWLAAVTTERKTANTQLTWFQKDKKAVVSKRFTGNKNR